MVVGTNTPDQPDKPEGPEEPKKPQMDAADLLSQMFGINPVERDKVLLGAQIDGALDRTLKFLQVIYFAKAVYGPQMTDKLARHYKSGIELLAENTDEAVKLFQKRHGEL